MASDTGNGATLAFTNMVGPVDTAFVGKVKSIELGDKSREALDDSGLNTTNFVEMLAGDLWTHSPITVTFLADPAPAAGVMPPEGTGTLTVTFSNQGSAGAATYACTGFITNIGLPTLVNDQLMEGSFQFQPDGKGTEPTFTRDST
jgi:hypothetical protein